MTQKDDEGQEWHDEPTLKHELGHLVMAGNTPVAIVPRESLAQQIVADHRDAQQLRERVRVLEEALRDIVRLHDLHGDWARVDTMADIARALLSPAAATEGGEGA